VRVKVAVLASALTFVILLLFAIVIGALAEQRIRSAFDDDLRAASADLQDRLSPTLTSTGQLKVDHDALLYAGAGDVLVQLVDTRGHVLYPGGGGLHLGLANVEGVQDVGDYRVVSRPLVVATRTPPEPFAPLGRSVVDTVAFVQYAKPETSMTRTVKRVRLFLAFGVLGGTLLAFLGGLYVARRAMRPIAGLTRAAREVARTRDPDITLPKPQANDEVSDLAHTLEDMLRELTAAREETEATLARQRVFVADASHELRTPLTSILANLELLESELSGEPREIADSALRSSRRMRRLVADLLLLARADAGREPPRAPVDLAAVAREAAGEAAALSSEHPLSLDLPGPVVVNGVGDDLHRLAANLVENALIHTPPGTPVTVSVRAEDGSAVLEVADRGPGVPSEQRERVFERFARGPLEGRAPGARAQTDGAPPGGSGLGLAIVRAVTDEHRGRVELLDADGGGARFLVTLPVGVGAGPPTTGLRGDQAGAAGQDGSGGTVVDRGRRTTPK
jgi:two-component system OmpR family sensor kinase